MKSYIVGNWKMNFTVGESSVYLHKLLQRIRAYRDIEVIVAPSTIALQPLSLQTDRKKIRLAAQSADPRDFGAYTGAVSCAQLRGIADYCLVGHSERRYLFGETDKYIQKTVAAALRNQLTPILCIGETETEHTFGETFDALRDQLLGGLAGVAAEDIPKVIVAYAPVWAISTTSGAHLASPDHTADIFAFLRNCLAEVYGTENAEAVPMLYGGNVNPSNAGAYLTMPGVNGVVLGNSSLVADNFVEVVDIAKRVKS